jgi:DNA-binding FadR family transcriptional regulator
MRITTVADGLRVPKTAELVARSLRGRIIRGELVEGQALPSEQVLTEQFGVSRPSLREAFRILEAERLIEVRRGSRGGARVCTPDVHVAATHTGLLLQVRGVCLADVYTARTVLEGPAAAAGAAQPPEGAVARLRSSVADTAALLAHDGDPEAVSRSAQEFHALLGELAGNRTLHLFGGMVDRIVAVANRAVVDAQGSPAGRLRQFRATQRTHGAVVDLIEAGDVAAADALWRRHLDEAERRLRQAPGADAPVDLLE